MIEALVDTFEPMAFIGTFLTGRRLAGCRYGSSAQAPDKVDQKRQNVHKGQSHSKERYHDLVERDMVRQKRRNVSKDLHGSEAGHDDGDENSEDGDDL